MDNVDETDVAEAVEATARLSLEIWLDFISNFTTALAWPIAIFAIAFLFRSELKNVASNLKRLKWGDAEAVFDEGVAEAKEVAKTLDPVDSQTASANDRQTYTLLQQAEVSPTGAVIEAYKRIEEQLEHISELARHDLVANMSDMSKRWSDPRKMPPSLLTRGLLKSGWLSHAEIAMLERLRETRNLAAHSREKNISQNSAKDFVRLAGTLEDSLQSKIDSAQPEA